MKYPLFLSCAFILLLSACAKDDDILDERDKFEGSWTCTETDNTGAKTTFTITFVKSGTADSMQITNFAQLNQKALVIINGNSMIFPNQTIEGFLLTNASGNYSDNRITMSYKLDNDQFTAECKR